MLCHKGGGETYLRFITLDYIGIWLVTGLCCITFLKATFFCFPQVRWIVTGCYFVTGFISLAYIKRGTNAVTRTQPLVILGLVRMSCLYPVRCIMASIGYTTGPVGTLWYLLGVELIGLFSGVINLSCLPEKWFEGKFDYFFNSHNVMHLFVLIAPIILHRGTVMDFQWMQTAKCLV